MGERTGGTEHAQVLMGERVVLGGRENLMGEPAAALGGREQKEA